MILLVSRVFSAENAAIQLIIRFGLSGPISAATDRVRLEQIASSFHLKMLLSCGAKLVSLSFLVPAGVRKIISTRTAPPASVAHQAISGTRSQKIHSF